MQELAPYLGIFIALAGLLYTAINNRSGKIDKALNEKADATAFAALLARTSMLENKITVIETDMKHIPNKDQAHRLELHVAQMGADIKALAQRVSDIADKLDVPPTG